MTITIQSVLYCLLIILLFYGVRLHSRIYVLALATVLYAFMLDIRAGIAVLGAAGVTYLAGILIYYMHIAGHRRISSVLAYIFILLAAASLIYYKVSGLPIPVGFSFYTFQIISYLIDIRKEKITPEYNPVKMILYLAWFPKFISGPIERKGDFDIRIKEITNARFLDPARWLRCLYYLLTGLMYKLVIADRIAGYTDFIFSDYKGMDGLWLFIGMFMYTLQIYFDFAGYSYTAIGFSAAFGMELTENFKMPYLSKNITEFWRRWHISLSSWLKDYLYIPLGGNRHGSMRKALNLLIVFTVCGLWHGWNLSFLIWGLLHGIYSILDSYLAGRGIKRIRSGIWGRIVTFISAAFAWIFFRASSALTAFEYIGRMFSPSAWFISFESDRQNMGFWKADIIILAVALIYSVCMEIMAYRKDISVPEVMPKLPAAARYAMVFICAVTIMVLGVYGPDTVNHNIYMQF